MTVLRPRRVAGALLAAGIAAGVGLSATAAVAAPASSGRAVTAGARWLSGQFENAAHKPVRNGTHFEAKYGKTWYPDYGENADAIFGLVAAGTQPHKVAVALKYLARTIGAYADTSGAAGGPYDGSLGKAAVAAEVAHVSGLPATHFGGHNLLALLKKDECTAADSTTGCVAKGAPRNIFAGISDSFVILAEARAGGTYAPSAAAVHYFLSLQCGDGGFTSGTAPCGAKGTPDLDSTSYALMALEALHNHPARVARTITYLRSQQKRAGYWVSQKVPNVNSTGLAAAALAARGVDVSAARRWLRSQQIPAGHAHAGAFRYAGTFVKTGAAVSPSVLATAQALPGLVAHGSLAVLRAGR